MADPVKTIRLLMNEKEFHAMLGKHVLEHHKVGEWHNASVNTLFMRDNQTDRLLQVRVEVTYSPMPDATVT